jgi:hypothetical protein
VLASLRIALTNGTKEEVFYKELFVKLLKAIFSKSAVLFFQSAAKLLFGNMNFLGT